MPDFRGLKFTGDSSAARRFLDVHKLVIVRKQDQLLVDAPGIVGDGGNSGFQAVNLAVQFAPRAIALVGFDCRLDRGVHWHGRHPPGTGNPLESNMRRWRGALDGVAATFKALRIRVVNCSAVSTLTAYPKMPLADMLAMKRWPKQC